VKVLSFASLFSDRASCQIVSGFAATHLALVGLGLPSWQCPFRYGLGIPCPGCGLTRAVKAFVQGDWQQAIAIHAFAPVVMVGLVLVIGGALLPEPQKIQIKRHLDGWEQQTRITVLLISLFLIYWLIRIIFFNKQLYRLVM
jgi:Protein of unknown function (DUF2752)